MRRMKPFISIALALLIGATSLGFALSAHTCKVDGTSNVSLMGLKACCGEVGATGDGFRPEPCCKVTVKHVKLATVRILVEDTHHALHWNAFLSPTMVSVSPLWTAPLPTATSGTDPPEVAFLVDGRAIQTRYCRYLI